MVYQLIVAECRVSPSPLFPLEPATLVYYSRRMQARALHTPDQIAAYLEEAFASCDKVQIAHALRTVVRPHGIDELGKSVGMSRAGIYKALGPEGNPSFAMVLQLLNLLGVGVSVHPLQRKATRKRTR